MNHPLFFLCLLPLFSAFVPPMRIPPKSDVSASAINSRYIFKFKSDADGAKLTQYLNATAAKVSQSSLASVSSSQGISPEAVTYGVRHAYKPTFFNGLSAVLSDDDLEDFKKTHAESIEYVEKDQLAYAEGVQQGAPSWGLARVSQWVNNLNSNKNYEYPDAAGQGVDVYVLDTGLNVAPSFEGRAQFLKNFVPGSSDRDVVGHGTHVAGTIASAKYGVAKKARIYGLKVLGDNGNGAYSGMISAVEFVTARARPGKTVMNLSLAGGVSQALNDAMKAARKKGVVVVVAAGNEHQNACNVSPASSVHVITTGATDQNDNTASFSNWGKCVDVFAPGVNIPSLNAMGNDGSSVMSGTSMASPHVAGVVALYMSMKQYNSADEVVHDVLGWSHRCVRGAQTGSGTGLVYANPKM